LMQEHPTLSIFAVPMRPERDVLGVITLYNLSPPPDVDLAEAQFLANAIGVSILGRFEQTESTDEVWSTRDRINQATGMIVAQLGIPPADALAILRAHAFAHGSTLEGVASAVVNRELDFRGNGSEAEKG
jgi:hypothetical protein